MKYLGRTSELVGRLVGALLAPLVAVGAAWRRGRLFHPEGLVFAAHVAPSPAAGRYAELAGRLAGPGLVRLSPALWRGDHGWPDVLGCAIRLGRGEPWDAEASAGDQDLLLATIPRPYLTPLGMLTTNASDFLANTYWAVSPFDPGGGLGRTYFRLVGIRAPAIAGPRGGRLLAAVAAGRARLRLEASSSPWRGYLPVAHVELEEQLALDQRALRFSPFRTGRGIVPRGFVHSLRPLVYKASQATRAAMSERGAKLRHSRPRAAEPPRAAPGAEPGPARSGEDRGRPGAAPPYA